MTLKSEMQASSAGSVMQGLLTIAAEALQRMPRHEALAMLAGVESGSHVLSSGVCITGAETVITSSIIDVASGASIDLPTIRVHPEAAVKPDGLH